MKIFRFFIESFPFRATLTSLECCAVKIKRKRSRTWACDDSRKIQCLFPGINRPNTFLQCVVYTGEIGTLASWCFWQRTPTDFSVHLFFQVPDFSSGQFPQPITDKISPKENTSSLRPPKDLHRTDFNPPGICERTFENFYFNLIDSRWNLFSTTCSIFL